MLAPTSHFRERSAGGAILGEGIDMSATSVHPSRSGRNGRRLPLKLLLASLAVSAVLGVSAVEAGSLAPGPRVIAERDRDFLERSGAQTIEELLDTGIVR